MGVTKLLKKAGALVASCMMLSLLIQPITTNAVTNEKVINVFHTNDTHSRVDDFSLMKTYIDGVGGNNLILDAGDTYHGQSFATIQRGSSIAKILDVMGYEAMAPGNHDFNYGYKRLLDLQAESKVPVLAGNVLKDGSPLFNSTISKEIDGIKFGIFGLATPETAYKTNPNNVEGLTFAQKEDTIELSKKYVKELKDQGANVIIALTHLGIDAESEFKSTDVAANVPGIDLLIDAHSHTSLDGYKDFNSKNKTQIVSAQQYLEVLGQVTFTFNADKTIKSISPQSVKLVRFDEVIKNGKKEQVRVPLYAENPEIKKIVDEIKNEQAPILNEVVGNSPIALDGRREIVRFGHSNLGRVLASAMLHETGAEIAITNGGGIRDSINAGEITKGEVIKVLPFGNYIVTKYLSGAEIVQALEHSMVIGSGSFAHYAGIKAETIVYTEVTKDSAGKDIVKERHKVVNVTVNGTPLDLNKQYLVATNDFMAVGGDGFTMFKGKPVVNEFAALDEAFINYVSKAGEASIVADDKDVRLVAKTSFTKEESKELIAKLLKEGKAFTFEANADKGTFLVYEEAGKVIKLAVAGTTVEEMNTLTEEIKNPTTPTTPETLPQTGGENPLFIFLFGIAIVSAGIYIKKKENIA